MKTILCIDDTVDHLNFYKDILSNDFKVITLSNSLETKHYIEKFSPDLILLDLYMPFKSGFQVLEELRFSSEVPIIVISSSIEDEAIENAFELGAIDFIGRQMSEKEILVRLKARLKSRPKEIEYLDYVLDMGKSSLKFNDEEVDLTPNEYKVIFHTFTNNGLISKSDLYTRAWPNQVFTDKTLNTHLTNLRKKLNGISSRVIIKRDGNIQFLKN
ncbi:MAG: hypothetical protein BM556_15740 [Bacteriovorax sp. MedPE-SWde]|nr:MAG: hypothetical protein BM556_15740 [Bacteriovorax sp. MedPE-SWde]